MFVVFLFAKKISSRWQTSKSATQLPLDMAHVPRRKLRLISGYRLRRYFANRNPIFYDGWIANLQVSIQMFVPVLAKASRLVNTPLRTLIPDCTINGRIGFMPPLLLGLN